MWQINMCLTYDWLSACKWTTRTLTKRLLPLCWLTGWLAVMIPPFGWQNNTRRFLCVPLTTGHGQKKLYSMSSLQFVVAGLLNYRRTKGTRNHIIIIIVVVIIIRQHHYDRHWEHHHSRLGENKRKTHFVFLFLSLSFTLSLSMFDVLSLCVCCSAIKVFGAGLSSIAGFSFFLFLCFAHFQFSFIFFSLPDFSFHNKILSVVFLVYYFALVVVRLCVLLSILNFLVIFAFSIVFMFLSILFSFYVLVYKFPWSQLSFDGVLCVNVRVCGHNGNKLSVNSKFVIPFLVIHSMDGKIPWLASRISWNIWNANLK